MCIAEITSVFLHNSLSFFLIQKCSSFFFLQVFLLLVKRLASLHYNHTELPQDNKDLKSCVSPTKKNSNSETISSCQKKRDSNTNQRSKANYEADYDEVDYQSTYDCNYKERINETISNSSRTQQNMGSNVSTAGGDKGLSGRRTQSSSEFFVPFFSSFFSFLFKT